MLGVLHDQAVADLPIHRLDEPVEDPEGAWLAIEQLGEVGLAQPAGDRIADLDADLVGGACAPDGVAR